MEDGLNEMGMTEERDVNFKAQLSKKSEITKEKHGLLRKVKFS